MTFFNPPFKNHMPGSRRLTAGFCLLTKAAHQRSLALVRPNLAERAESGVTLE